MRSSDGSRNVCAVILCAGSGSRANLGYNKILYHIGKKPLIETTLDAFSCSKVNSVVLVINPSDEKAINGIAAPYPNITIAYGGNTRTRSVRNGLKAAKGCDIVVIHDGARPFVTPGLINKTIESAIKFGSGIAAVPATDTIKEADGDVITRGLKRDNLRCMQTPQTFDYKALCEAYDKTDGDYTDDAEAWQIAGNTAHTVVGEYDNIKVTTPTDLYRGAPKRTKIGMGFDVHELVHGRPLILGGVSIPHEKGLLGHSDADVLTHAIMDALLSAADLPDIGVLFPDNDSSTENISSFILLGKVMELIKERGYTVGNVSAVVMAQKPKMVPHIPKMKTELSKLLCTTEINVSATTTERLGIIGEEKGIAASATCLLFY